MTSQLHIRPRMIFLIAFLMLGLLSGFGGVRSTAPDRYLTQRYLTGLKVKMADNFTLGCWGALYYGNSFFPNYFRFDPLRYQGYDIVPGFVVDIGPLIGNAKLSLAGDYYYLWRNWEYDNEASVRQDRARGSIIVNIPFAGNFKLTINQMFERIQHQRWLREQDDSGRYYGEFTRRQGPTTSYFRYRTNFKITAPPMSPLKISPYASYEGYNFRPTEDIPPDPFYLEVELGLTMVPFKGFTFNLADQIQTTPERRGWETHQISLYLFYTLDFSKYFSAK